MKQEIEQIIKKNLPEKKVGYCKLHSFTGSEADRGMCEDCAMEELEHSSFNQALSSIDTSLIADEVLKVVKLEIEKKYPNYKENYHDEVEEIINLLSEHLSPNKENK